MIRKFITYSLIILFLLIGVNFTLNYLYKNIIRKENSNYIKDKQFEELKDSIKILFLGDSHIMNGIASCEIPNSFNYGSGEESYIQTYYRLKRIISDKTNLPEYIILNTDLSSFTSYRNKKVKHADYWVDNMDYFEIAETLNDKKYISKWFEGKYAAYLGNYFVFLKYLLPKKKERIKICNGYKPKYEDYFKHHDIENYAKNRAALYFNGYDYKDKYLIEYFKRIAEICEQNKISLYLIKMPLSKPYYENVALKFNIDEYYLSLDSIRAKYNCIKDILDYQHLFFNKTEYFHNPDHLNDKGAKTLSDSIKSDLVLKNIL